MVLQPIPRASSKPFGRKSKIDPDLEPRKKWCGPDCILRRSSTYSEKACDRGHPSNELRTMEKGKKADKSIKRREKGKYLIYRALQWNHTRTFCSFNTQMSVRSCQDHHGSYRYLSYWLCLQFSAHHMMN